MSNKKRKRPNLKSDSYGSKMVSLAASECNGIECVLLKMCGFCVLTFSANINKVSLNRINIFLFIQKTYAHSGDKNPSVFVLAFSLSLYVHFSFPNCVYLYLDNGCCYKVCLIQLNILCKFPIKYRKNTHATSGWQTDTNSSQIRSHHHVCFQSTIQIHFSNSFRIIIFGVNIEWILIQNHSNVWRNGKKRKERTRTHAQTWQEEEDGEKRSQTLLSGFT